MITIPKKLPEGDEPILFQRDAYRTMLWVSMVGAGVEFDISRLDAGEPEDPDLMICAYMRTQDRSKHTKGFSAIILSQLSCKDSQESMDQIVDDLIGEAWEEFGRQQGFFFGGTLPLFKRQKMLEGLEQGLKDRLQEFVGRRCTIENRDRIQEIVAKEIRQQSPSQSPVLIGIGEPHGPYGFPSICMEPSPKTKEALELLDEVFACTAELVELSEDQEIVQRMIQLRKRREAFK